MFYKYVLKAETVYSEDEEEFTVYGIEAIDGNRKVILSYPDIFFNKEKAVKFVNFCNRIEVPLIYLEYHIGLILNW